MSTKEFKAYARINIEISSQGTLKRQTIPWWTDIEIKVKEFETPISPELSILLLALAH